MVIVRRLREHTRRRPTPRARVEGGQVNAAPMHAADWLVCAVAFLVLIVATWWTLYGGRGIER